MTFSGWIGVLSGWYVTEIGRQPYLVTGVLTTAEAVTKLPTGMVLSSLLAYLAVYVGLLLAYIWVVFYLTRKVDDKSISKRNIIPSSASATNAVGAQ